MPTPLASIADVLAPGAIAVVGAMERQGAPSRRIIEPLSALDANLREEVRIEL